MKVGEMEGPGGVMQVTHAQPLGIVVLERYFGTDGGS